MVWKILEKKAKKTQSKKKKTFLLLSSDFKTIYIPFLWDFSLIFFFFPVFSQFFFVLLKCCVNQFIRVNYLRVYFNFFFFLPTYPLPFPIKLNFNQKVFFLYNREGSWWHLLSNAWNFYSVVVYIGRVKAHLCIIW